MSQFSDAEGYELKRRIAKATAMLAKFREQLHAWPTLQRRIDELTAVLEGKVSSLEVAE